MNRQQRRLKARQESKAQKHLGWIIELFENLLFQNNGYDYESLFVACSCAWQVRSKQFNLRFGGKGFEVDSYWFYNTYKPLEGRFARV